MGCDIHIITEIRKNNKWEYVPDVPISLTKRNYNTFSVLAGVRDSFNNQIFKEKGLPSDISAKKFLFDSSREHALELYETSSNFMCRLPDGSVIDYYDERLKHVITETEYKYINKNSNDELKKRYAGGGWSEVNMQIEYYVYDASLLSGNFENVPYKDLYPTFQDYLNANWADEYDADAQDYGNWKTDFDCEDYHTQSYITLKEFLEADYTDYKSIKYKMDKRFYNAFKEAGGVFPEIFTVREESPIGTFVDAVAEAYSPTVMISYPMSEEKTKELQVFIGIKELKEIAEKYDIKNPEDIRIVFAFDN